MYTHSMCMYMHIYFDSLKTWLEELTSVVHQAQQPASDCGSGPPLQEKKKDKTSVRYKIKFPLVLQIPS